MPPAFPEARLIEVQQLTKVYGTTRAVDRLDFTVRKGEVLGFLGPNGAGKSTTMRILAGSLGATEGRVTIGGIDVLDRPLETKRQIGYLPEVPPLYTEMVVRDYLRFCATLKQAADPHRRTEAVMEQVGLTEVAHRLIVHLSKGFRQRVGLAQALVHEPRVLILDEPASGLDPAQRKDIRDLVRELSRGEVTVVLSTHVLAEVEALCDRVLIIQQGRILAEDSIEALAGDVTTIRLRVARPGPTLLDVLQQVDQVRAVESSEPGLYRIQAAADVREALAHVAVEHGLLELGTVADLESAYLALTASEEAS